MLLEFEMTTFQPAQTPSSGDEAPLATSRNEDIPLLRGDSVASTRLRSGEPQVDINVLNDFTHYDDFHTIDWVRDRTRERYRQKALARKVRKGGYADKLKKSYDASSGWIIVLLVGMATGFAAGVIDIGTTWMSDLKEGVCMDSFYFNKEACCFGSNETSYEVEHCKEWKTWAELFLTTDDEHQVYIFNYFFYVIVSAMFGTMCVWLVRTFAPYACGSGIPEVKTILSGFVIHGYLGARTLFVKSLTIMMAVAAGLSLGKEGPLVHVACCCGNIFARIHSKYRRNEAKRREILSAASAAGVSVAFGAPIGGVLFSLEEVSYYFPHKTMWRSFFSALVAAFVLQQMHPYQTDHIVMFYANYSTPWNLFELLPFLALGVFGGVFGAIFIHANLWWCKLRRSTRLGKYPIIEVLGVSFLTAMFAYPNQYTRMGASELIAVLVKSCSAADASLLCDYNQSSILNVNDRYSEHYDEVALSGVMRSLWLLTLAMVFKGFITVFTFGLKVPSGLFIPSMAVGACVGRIVGIGMQQLAWRYKDHSFFLYFCPTSVGCIEPGLYAMVGAAASLGGVTRMTVSLVVIMFELTGGLQYIVPLMVAIMTSKWVGDSLSKGGIYDGHILLNGYPFLDSKEDFEHITLACDVMRPRRNEAPLTTISICGTTVGCIKNLLNTTVYKGFPVVVDNESQLLEGYINRQEVSVALDRALKSYGVTENSLVYFSARPPRNLDTNRDQQVGLAHILDASPFQVTEQTPMETVVEMFRKIGLRQALVVRNGRLLGIITKKDVLKHVDQMSTVDVDARIVH
ncbi:H(+)/Cl(-) exchange transporter 5-like [Sycon ciliatum]|uniref:H(+)/Cl(-) exchange transporter 5-like n=1 Tax=Sycon ciliatum TaxID=27933 RepID=UPI0020AAB0DF|eukprot:scpid42835/ scgid29180/ H(+)/Cl(-) exchange transporter 3; Chloride channel protein 3; Chloride transporter ClC-3